MLRDDELLLRALLELLLLRDDELVDLLELADELDVPEVAVVLVEVVGLATVRLYEVVERDDELLVLPIALFTLLSRFDVLLDVLRVVDEIEVLPDEVLLFTLLDVPMLFPLRVTVERVEVVGLV